MSSIVLQPGLGASTSVFPSDFRDNLVGLSDRVFIQISDRNFVQRSTKYVDPVTYLTLQSPSIMLNERMS